MRDSPRSIGQRDYHNSDERRRLLLLAVIGGILAGFPFRWQYSKALHQGWFDNEGEFDKLEKSDWEPKGGEVAGKAIRNEH